MGTAANLPNGTWQASSSVTVRERNSHILDAQQPTTSLRCCVSQMVEKMTSFEDILVEGLGKSFDRRPKIDEPKLALEPLNHIGRVTPKGLMAQKGATIHEGCT